MPGMAVAECWCARMARQLVGTRPGRAQPGGPELADTDFDAVPFSGYAGQGACAGRLRQRQLVRAFAGERERERRRLTDVVCDRRLRGGAGRRGRGDPGACRLR